MTLFYLYCALVVGFVLGFFVSAILTSNANDRKD